MFLFKKHIKSICFIKQKKTYRIYMFSKNKHIDSICFIDKHIESI